MPKYYDGPGRVLVGYDGSADSHAALRLAVNEARNSDADLIIVKAVDDIVFGSAWGVVVEPEKLTSTGTDQIREAVEMAQAEGFPIERIRTDVLMGSPATQLSKLSERVNLVVVGRRSTQSKKAFVGSTTLGLAGMTRSPVIVTGSEHTTPTGSAKSIVVGVDVSRNRGRVALSWAFDLADRDEANLTILGIAREASGRWFRGQPLSPEQVEQTIDSTRKRVEALAEPYQDANPDVEAAIEVVYGSPARLLIERSESTDLLIVEVQSAFPSFAVGAIGRSVMTHSHCPVGLVRSSEIYAS